MKKMNVMKKYYVYAIGAVGAILTPAMSFATTLTVPTIGTTDLFAIAGEALAFIAIIVALVAGIKIFKSSK